MGTIDPEDLKISLEDMAKALGIMNIPTYVRWNPSETFPPEFSLCVLDTLEDILEYEDFMIKEILIETISDGVKFEIRRTGDDQNRSPYSEMSGDAQKKPVYKDTTNRYTLFSQNLSDGYRTILLMGGDQHAAEA